MQYDVFLSHNSLDKPWVDCLARNLRAAGLDVFYDTWEMIPGNGVATSLDGALEASRAGILIVTEAARESGWVRDEYEKMVALRNRRGSDFRVVPVIFGHLDEVRFPFLETVLCVNFADSGPEAYRQGFHRLLCGLRDEAPGDGTYDGKLEFPAPTDDGARAPLASERGVLDEIFATLTSNPMLLLLAQADRRQAALVGALLERARARFGAGAVFHLTPPYSAAAEVGRYFARLGRQCGFAEETRDPLDWEDALVARLEGGESLFMVVSGFEHGSASGRGELAGTLRGLGDRYGRDFQVVLTGGEQLAALKHAEGGHSLLWGVEELAWPEPTTADVAAWQAELDGASPLSEEEVRRLLEVCGGHPRLVRRCLLKGAAGDGARRAVLEYSFVEQMFLPFRGGAEQGRVCELLGRGVVGEFESWPEDGLLRRLYWGNFLRVEGRRFVWRGEVLREVGRKVLRCG